MDTPPLKRIEANGLQFAYFDSGEGPLALCMHGFPDTPHTWLEHIAPSLVSAGYRVVAPYSRGYAPTDIPDDDDYRGLTLAADLLALIEAFGEDDATLITHDWGAYAGHIASLLEPERIRALVAIDVPHPNAVQASLSAAWSMRHFIAFQFRGWSVRRLMRNDRAAIAKLWRRWSPSWSFTDEDLAPIRACFDEARVVGAAIDYYRAFMRDQRGERAERLQSVLKRTGEVPTLTLAGDEGPAPIDDFEYAATFYDAPYEFVCMPGTGHFVHREAPEDTADAMLSFLERHDGALDDT
jgi:pimeloyl-ACP methyl ester carboxylesterase